MAKETSVSLPSGTLLSSRNNPLLSQTVTPDKYPNHSAKSKRGNADLWNRQGTNAVILNPQDFSVFLGIAHKAVTVGTSATQLSSNPIEGRRALVIANNSSTTIYIGDSSVTTADGFPLVANEKIAIDIMGNISVFAVAGSNVDVRVLELA